jgi:hypothetical protein
MVMDCVTLTGFEVRGDPAMTVFAPPGPCSNPETQNSVMHVAVVLQSKSRSVESLPMVEL